MVKKNFDFSKVSAPRGSIIIVTENYIFDPEQKHYTDEWVQYNKRYQGIVESKCRHDIEVLLDSRDWVVAICRNNLENTNP